MKPKSKQAPVTFIRLPETIRREVKKIADREMRPMANMLRVLVAEALERRNQIPSGDTP